MARDSAILILCSGFTIPEVLYLVGVWGYKYKNILLVWFKEKLGLGFWTRANVEFIVFATKGKFAKYRNT